MLRRTTRLGIRLCATTVTALVCASATSAFAQQSTDEIHISSDGPTGEAAPTGNTTTPADDTSARPGELVIVVHDLPPGASASPSTTPTFQPQSSTVSQQPVLPAETPDTEQLRERAFAPGVVFGANTSIGGPSGVLGVFVEAAPIRALSVRLGAGIGINFGPSIETGALVRVARWGRIAPVLSLTYSTNFTPGTWRSILGLDAAANSHWMTPSIGVELRLRPIVLLRFHVGAAVLLNTGDFSNYANGTWWGPSRPPSFLGYSPLSAADAHDEGRALVTPAIWVDVGVLGPQW